MKVGISVGGVGVNIFTCRPVWIMFHTGRHTVRWVLAGTG